MRKIIDRFLKHGIEPEGVNLSTGEITIQTPVFEEEESPSKVKAEVLRRMRAGDFIRDFVCQQCQEKLYMVGSYGWFEKPSCPICGTTDYVRCVGFREE